MTNTVDIGYYVVRITHNAIGASSRRRVRVNMNDVDGSIIEQVPFAYNPYYVTTSVLLGLGEPTLSAGKVGRFVSERKFHTPEQVAEYLQGFHGTSQPSNVLANCGWMGAMDADQEARVRAESATDNESEGV